MSQLYPHLVGLHGLFGVVALATFWTAALLRKGTPLHRRVGQTYLAAMVGICLTAVPMVWVFVQRGRIGIAVFLAYLVVITATAMWLGWRAIRRRRHQAQFRDRAYAGVAMLNLVAALIVFGIGWQMQQALLMGFSVVGLATGTQMLVARARPSSHGNWWLQEHYAAMVACGAATHVAFLSIGLGRLARAAGFTVPGWYGLLAWFVPVALAVIATTLLHRRYRRAGRIPAGSAVAVAN
ncbi:MAG: hypothetical protein KF823_12045 [Xanthomonadales bacterium]|nr:hypothetical protein [Xanthomonadales bacterium]